jgi:hypothetical protein
MLRTVLATLVAVLALAGCSSSSPKVIQATADLEEVRLIQGMATQIEMPAGERVQTVTIGNPRMVAAERSGDVVSLLGGEGTGETNAIIRTVDAGGRSRVYQYRVVVMAR